MDVISEQLPSKMKKYPFEERWKEGSPDLLKYDPANIFKYVPLKFLSQ